MLLFRLSENLDVFICGGVPLHPLAGLLFGHRGNIATTASLVLTTGARILACGAALTVQEELTRFLLVELFFPVREVAATAAIVCTAQPLCRVGVVHPAIDDFFHAFSFCPLPWAAGVVCLAAGIGSLCGAARQGVRPGVHACFACQRASRAAQMIRRVRGESSKKCLFMCVSPVRCCFACDPVPCRLLWLHCTTTPGEMSSPVPCNLLFAQNLYRAFVQFGTVQGGGGGDIIYL